MKHDIHVDFLKIKEKVDRAQEQANRAEGALEQIKKQLKDEFGFSTLAKAKEGLEKLKVRTELATNKFENSLEEFKDKWQDELERTT